VVPPLIDEAHRVLKAWLKFALERECLCVVPIHILFRDLTEVNQNAEMHDELYAHRNDQTPVENRRRWLLLVELLERRVEAQHHEDDGNAKAEIGRLVVTHLDSVEVQGAHCIR